MKQAKILQFRCKNMPPKCRRYKVGNPPLSMSTWTEYDRNGGTIIGTQPVIFDIAYTPYRLKKNATASEITAHQKKRSFYDFTGADNHYKYITTDGKVFGEEAKKFTMLEYLQKSTGVFNQNGMIEYEELKRMKARAQSGEKNLWHGFISFNEENSEKIDHPEKCIALVKSVFGEFFHNAGFDPSNMDLMCSLHLDRPHHLHVHYEFWEKEPKVKNERAAGYKYRAKGKIQMSAIDKMTERLNAYTLDDDLARKRDKAVDALYRRSDFSKVHMTDVATKMMLTLAEKIPKGATFQYGRKDMIPYRDDVDNIVEMIAMTDNSVFWADNAFRDELKKKEKALQGIMGNYYKERMKKDGVFKDYMTDAADLSGVKHIQTIDRLNWDYRRRLGNVVLNNVRHIQDNTYRYDKNKKHKANDKTLKRNLSVSNRIIRRSLKDMFGSILDWFLPETRVYGNRLKEIEEEMQADHIQEQQTQKPTQEKSNRYSWGKD